METNGGSGAAPTGCYKCGRPGHWSRDCPSDPTSNSNNDGSSKKPAASSHPFKASGGVGGASFQGPKQPIEKPKKVPKTRPKLTPELLLSDDGLGFVLRHFPKAFKYHGRGHETNDLGNLLSLYAEWHSHLIPYYSFNQFVHKVEQVGATKRVKLCLNDLREKVAHGGDPAKILETTQQNENSNPNPEQDVNDLEDLNLHPEDNLPNHDDTDDFQHDMMNDIFENPTEEASGALNNEAMSADKSEPNIEMTEELKARIEANRLKALERAAARKRALESQES
ncbi:unnamed protein product [Lactuca saligna]|uniref:CCHC-type domain-containing protein n=1 Tax=Lactuca saligna TaxID=75948 RepID=A0AA35YJU8_LACSI|nr:unnamed protein product [Lactuca saligna]